MWEHVPSNMCSHWRLKSVCTSEQFDQSSVSTWRNFASLVSQNELSEDFDQSAHMHRLIWIVIGHTCQKLCFLILWLLSVEKYHNNPKYWDTLSTYHTCPKIWNSPFYYLSMCLKYCCMYSKQCRPRSDAEFCSVWSWSTLFARTYLSQYLGLLR